MARRRKLDEELAALHRATEDPSSEEARVAIAAALPSRASFVVAQAAGVVRDHTLDGFGEALALALEQFLIDGVKRDPGCHAKLAIVEAMDAIDHLDHEPFERAARHVQLEPSWGPPEDTAAALRARAALALARAGYSDLVLLAGELLSDRAPNVRRAALVALGVHGDRAGAGLARYKLDLGDDDPLVTADAMATLLVLAPKIGIGVLARLLEEDERGLRELALVALGESKRPDALDVLLGHLERAVRTEDRATAFTALALHRSEPALRVLLEWIAGRPHDAAAALEALSVRRFETDVVERARAQARAHDRLDLFKDAFLQSSEPG